MRYTRGATSRRSVIIQRRGASTEEKERLRNPLRVTPRRSEYTSAGALVNTRKRSYGCPHNSRPGVRVSIAAKSNGSVRDVFKDVEP